MTDLLVIEDGNVIENVNKYFWGGLFSTCVKDGYIVSYVQSIMPKNTIIVIPHCDGNILQNDDSETHYSIFWPAIQKYIDKAKQSNKIFILGTVAQYKGKEEPNINYLYLPQHDQFFNLGVTSFFNKDIINWSDKGNELRWRGSCSGAGGNKSLRVRFVEKLYQDNPDVRLSKWWSENKQIPSDLFGDRVDYTHFLKDKIYFIVDGNGISSNMMWGFATNSVPIIISDMKCWFTEFAKDGVHYLSVKTDLSNLHEKIEWVKNNDKEAEIIAKNAYNFAKLIFSSEFQKLYLKTQIDTFCQNT